MLLLTVTFEYVFSKQAHNLDEKAFLVNSCNCEKTGVWRKVRCTGCTWDPRLLTRGPA